MGRFDKEVGVTPSVPEQLIYQLTTTYDAITIARECRTEDGEHRAFKVLEKLLLRIIHTFHSRVFYILRSRLCMIPNLADGKHVSILKTTR